MTKIKRKMFIGILFALFVTAFCAAPPAYAAKDFNPDCDPVSAYANKAAENRWWKPIFDIVSNATVSVGETTFSTTAPSAVKLMVVGLGLWLAIFTMKMVASMKEQDPMEYLTHVGGMMFKSAFAAVFLRNSSFFFGYIVAPITAVGAGFAGLSAGAGSGLSSVVEPLGALMEDMHKSIAMGIGVGQAAQCLSWIHDFSIFGKTLFTLPEFAVLLSGCMLEVGCWILLIAFPFRIFDALFRLGVTAALCPLFIVAWVFPVTAGLAKKGLNSVLHVTFLFLCLKIILDLDIELLLGATGLGVLTSAGPKEAMDQMRATGSEESPANSSFIVMVVCIFYSVLFLMKADELANYFSEASFSNDTAYAAAKNTFEGGKMAVSKGGGLVASKAAGAVDKKAARTVQDMREKKQKAAATGQTYNPSRKEKAAEYYLKKRGVIAANGADTDKMGKLLQNSVWRDARGAIAKNREQRLFNKIDRRDRDGSWRSSEQRDRAFERLEKRGRKVEKNKDYSAGYSKDEGRTHRS